MVAERNQKRREYFFDGMQEAVGKVSGGQKRALIPPFSYSLADRRYLMRVAVWMHENGRVNDELGLRDCMDYYLVENNCNGMRVEARWDDVDKANVYYVAKVEDMRVNGRLSVHPEPDLMEELILHLPRARILYGEEFIDGVNSMVKKHLTDCADCSKTLRKVVKDY